MRRNQSGNVLFLILIAVALFAALSYAITSSNRGGKTSTTSETGDLVASRALNFTTALQTGIMHLSSIRGVSISELKFNNDVTTNFDGTAYPLGALGTPSDPSLYVFHPQGGGVIPQQFENAVTPFIGCGTSQVKSGHFGVYWVRAPGVGTEDGDIIMQINDLRDDACLATNRKIGINFIPNINYAGGQFIQNSTTPPVGQGASTGSTPEDFNAIDGRLIYCFKKINSPVRNVYVAVLKAY